MKNYLIQVLSGVNIINAALKSIVVELERKQEDTILIGLDIEWSWNNCKPVGLIQLAMELPSTKIYLIQVADFTRVHVLPHYLKRVLEHPKISFSGNRIQVDVAKMERDFQVKFLQDNLIKLDHLCYEKGIFETKRSSLEKQCLKVLGFLLPKDPAVRCSDWSSKKHLTQSQIQYAARDAWASHLIAKKLEV